MVPKLILLLLICFLLMKPSFQCPNQCHCLEDGLVTCSKELHEIPKDIPISTTSLQITGENVQTSIPDLGTSLHGFQNLGVLEISYSGIKKLENDVFQGLVSLRKLYLNNNNISFIGPETFKKTPGLLYLDLSENKIAVVPNDLFVLKQLMVLSLKNNAIKTLPRDSFRHLGRAAVIDISGNKIDFFDDQLQGLANVRVLRMNSCGIKNLSVNFFQYTTQITQLQLKNNFISNVDQRLFTITDKLKEIYLDDNDIDDLKTVNSSLTKTTRILLNLLSLKNNRIRTLQKGDLETFRVRSLYFDNNEITSIKPLFLDDMSGKLSRLSLTGNQLSQLPKNAFQHLLRLNKLYISGNNLTEFSDTYISNLDLKYLDLSKNRITKLNKEALDTFSKITTVDLSDNLWNCTCAIKPVYDWLKANLYSQSCSNKRDTTKRKESMNCLKCFTPKAGTLITSLSIDDVTCVAIIATSTSYVTVIVLIVIGVILLLALGIFFLCCYLKRIKSRHRYSIVRRHVDIKISQVEKEPGVKIDEKICQKDDTMIENEIDSVKDDHTNIKESKNDVSNIEDDKKQNKTDLENDNNDSDINKRNDSFNEPKIINEAQSEPSSQCSNSSLSSKRSSSSSDNLFDDNQNNRFTEKERSQSEELLNERRPVKPFRPLLSNGDTNYQNSTASLEEVGKAYQEVQPGQAIQLQRMASKKRKSNPYLKKPDIVA